ncbi:helix-turn-helix domain-containing protein [Caballeronia sp. LP003]|nr:helix-turn-helix domain-containing protein [Caballeronia sp. LP003]MDR5785361.1 helix-turn-helix domain-containing protein [Caballeronia sp. LP003]
MRQVVSHDADEQAGNLHGWRQLYDQLSAGRFVGMLEETHVDGMHLFRETTSQCLRQTCEVPADACWFGIPLTRGATGRIHARALDDDALAFRPGGVEFELTTPPGYEIFGVVMKHAALRDYARTVEHLALEDALPRGETVIISPAKRAQLAAALLSMLRSGASVPSVVLAWIFESGALGCGADAPLPAPSRRGEIAAAARRHVLAHRDRAVNVPELCAHLHVSRRTLQYCFQEAFGMAPNVYLRTLRLNGARRDLRHAAQRAQSVQDIAASWGFWHLSQFALDYRRLFGVRPSDTRAQGLATIDR